MNEFRRLISYIYEYEGKVKGKNVGFVKLEARNGLCKLNISVKKLYMGSGSMGVYLLSARKEILLGNLFLRNGCGEFRTVVQVSNIEESGETMDECYGLSIHEKNNHWKEYTTIWEDSVAQAAQLAAESATSEATADKELENKTLIPTIRESEKKAEEKTEENKDAEEVAIKEEVTAKTVAETEAADNALVEAESVANVVQETEFADKTDVMQPENENQNVQSGIIVEIQKEIQKERTIESHFDKPSSQTEEESHISDDPAAEQSVQQDVLPRHELNPSPSSGSQQAAAQPVARTRMPFSVPNFRLPGTSSATQQQTARQAPSPTQGQIRQAPSPTQGQIRQAPFPTQGQIRQAPFSTQGQIRQAPFPTQGQIRQAPFSTQGQMRQTFSPPQSQVRQASSPLQSQTRQASPPPQKMRQAETFQENQIKEHEQNPENLVIRQEKEEPLLIGDPEALAKLEEEEQAVPIPLWDFLVNTYPKIQAFDSQYGCQVLVIKPQDIGLLPREVWIYGNNSFLLHGYYNYRYLILARLENPNGAPRYLLGVPGHYFSNEKYMASMFGFPHFVLSKRQQPQDGRFGYWYTDIRLDNGSVPTVVAAHCPLQESMPQ